MSIKIEKKNDRLLLHYEPERSGGAWVHGKLNEEGECWIKVFRFAKGDLIKSPEIDEDDARDWSDEPIWTFKLASSEGKYYRIKASILGTKHDVFLAKNLDIDHKMFIATRDISVFSKIDDLVEESIVIDGDKDNAIPADDFDRLLKTFPTTTELNHYAHSRISLILKEYLGTMTDAQKKFDNYMTKRRPLRHTAHESNLYGLETHKYEYIHGRIKEMLVQSDAYSESEWQKLMLEFILVIFPKYIAVLKNVGVKDYYSNKRDTTIRKIDLVLVDAIGSVDVIEIKKPCEGCLLSTAKYRDNYTPKKELSGAIMQAEKYLLHLNKWGVSGEREMTAKYAHLLPENMEIRITNPKAMVIAGRSSSFSNDQSFDFEIIRRKYANLLDIITYDDLLKRIKNIISKFQRHSA